jgi:hypothetical protein
MVALAAVAVAVTQLLAQEEQVLKDLTVEPEERYQLLPQVVEDIQQPEARLLATMAEPAGQEHRHILRGARQPEQVKT